MSRRHRNHLIRPLIHTYIHTYIHDTEQAPQK
jgi:hypothetical protein